MLNKFFRTIAVIAALAFPAVAIAQQQGLPGPGPNSYFLPLNGGTLAGALTFGATNTYDIGTSATVLAPRTIYAGTSFVGPVGTFTTSMSAPVATHSTSVAVGVGSAITSSGPGGALVSTAFTAIGTSGATVPLLNGANTWSAQNIIVGTGSSSATEAFQVKDSGSVVHFGIRNDGRVFGGGFGEFYDSVFNLGDSTSGGTSSFTIHPTSGGGGTFVSSFGSGSAGNLYLQAATNLIVQLATSTNFIVHDHSSNNLFAVVEATGVTYIKSASATAFNVGAVGSTTTPAFQVDASTASQVAGLKVTGAATGGTVALAAIDSGSNTNLTINAKGSGTIGIGTVSSGAVTITPALSIGAGSGITTSGPGGALVSTAFTAIGTSGATIPLLNAANTWGTATQIFNGAKGSGPGASDLGFFRITASNNGVQLGVGNYSAANYGMWIQGGDTVNNSSTYPIILQPLSGGVGIGPVNAVANSSDALYIYGPGSTNASTAIRAHKADGTEIFKVRDDGAVYMAGLANSSTTSAVCFTTSGGGLSYNSTVGTCTVSTIAAKNLKAPLTPKEGFDMVMSMEPWRYELKEGLPTYTPGEQIGLVAEFADKKDHRIVATDPDGRIAGVRYEQYTAALTAAVQYLKADNDNLRADVDALKRASRR